MAVDIKQTALSPGHSLSGERVRRISRLNKIKRNIGTWNVQSMYQAGKAANIIKEMARLDIDILGCSETRWPGNGKTLIDDYFIYYSGDETSRNRNGVAIIVKKDVAGSIIGFFPVSDRVALLKVSAKPINLNILQVYAPTAESTDREVECFYQEIADSLKYMKKEETNVIMGDFNAKVGKGEVDSIVGKYGLGIRNERGDRLIQFCQETNYVIMNTQFQLPPRRLYTWKSPADTPRRIIRNQIDYLLINKRFRNAITSVKTCPGADIHSDHSLLLGKIRIRAKRVRKNEKRPRIDVRMLNETNIRKKVKEDIEKKFENILKLETEDKINEQWNKIKDILVSTTKIYLEQKKRKNNPWMTDNILQMMEIRRKYKNTDLAKYKEHHRKVLKEIKTAKENWLAERCLEMEILDRKHDIFGLHKKIKETIGKHASASSNVIEDKNCNLLFSVEDKLNRWTEYMTELFDDNNEIEITEGTSYGPEITKDEVSVAIKRLKNGKSPGLDEIHGEVLKLLGDGQISILTQFFNNIYKTGNIPQDWLTSIFIPLPKKRNARKCEEHRTISLMSHVLKILLNIVHARIYRRLEENISRFQFGFRNGFGTREALFSIQVLIQRARDINRDVFACFIDFEKAFDKVPHNRLVETLKKSNIDDKDIRLIANLYKKQTATIRIDNLFSDKIPVKRGVRQGCILSPILFNAYSETLFREALGETEDGITINGEVINNLRYADDTVLLADSAEGLQRLIDQVVSASEKYGMKLNSKKTQIMTISKNQNNNVQFFAGNDPLKQTDKITYLGYNITDSWDHSYEVRSRIEKARSAFNQLKKVLCSLKLNIQLRLRVLKCYVFSVLLYGVEAWTLTEATTKRLQAFEMWCYRRMLRISWVHHVTNEAVLQRLHKTTEIITIIKERKLQYFGHIMRNTKYQLLQLILQGKIEGRRGPGRRRTSWLKNLRQWTGLTTVELFRSAVNKVRWANVIANIHRG